MSSFCKIPNGEYYYFFNHMGTEKIVRATAGNQGLLLDKVRLRVPNELVGKRVRLKLEIVEE